MAACKKAALTCGLPKIRLAALFENVNRFGRKIFATAWLGREVRRRRTVPTRRVARRLPSHPRTRMTGSAHTSENGPDSKDDGQANPSQSSTAHNYQPASPFAISGRSHAKSGTLQSARPPGAAGYRDRPNGRDSCGTPAKIMPKQVIRQSKRGQPTSTNLQKRSLLCNMDAWQKMRLLSH